MELLGKDLSKRISGTLQKVVYSDDPLSFTIIMATVVEKVEMYTAKCAELGMNIGGGLLARAAKACGPALFNADAETVAASDQTELETVRNNFVMKKLGVEDAEEAMNIVNQVAEEMKEFGSHKYRAVFYARCAEIAGKEDMLPEVE